MPKLAKALGALAVSRLEKPGLHAVGTVPGLCLNISETGAKAWVLRTMVGNKRREIGLGGYPAVTLAGALEKARVMRDDVRERGVDPVERRQLAASALKAEQASGKTFKDCADAYIKAHAPGWKNPKHKQQWENTLDAYAYPLIGSLMVRHVGKEQVLSVLEQPADAKNPAGLKLWYAKAETASRLRGRIESVLDWAAARGYREGENPARWRGHLDKLLPKRSKVAKQEHFKALPVGEIGDFMARLRQQEGTGALAVQFAILTAARSGEVRGAVWSEIDLQAGVWVIPAERMKADREHRVPLSAAAVALLKTLPEHTDADLVFPAPRLGQLSDMTLTAVLRRMKIDATVHGMRSTFRDWAAERTNYPNEMAEMALAHVVSDKTEAAYRRGDLFEKRRRMMEDWANFLAQPSARAGEVIPMKQARA